MTLFIIILNNKTMETTVKERLMTFISYLGIGQGKFEKECGVANGYVNNIRRSITDEKLQKIALRYPELNKVWLLTGEGEMLRGGVTQSSHGDNSPNVLGNGNRVSVSPTVDKVLEEFAQQRKLTEKAQAQTDKAQTQTDRAQEQVSKAQEQIDRLITLIERMQKS